MAGKKGIANTSMWILMGLLILGLGGFGVTNLSGSVRSVGAVGETDIEINDYARALRASIRAEEAERGEPLSFAQAEDLQLDARVLGQLVATASLEEEARAMGVSVGDENLRQQIMDIPAFQGIDGSFDRDAYRLRLDSTGMSEAEFEEDLRAEAARTLLQSAVVTGVDLPAIYSDTLMQYVGARRTVTWAMLDRDDLITGLPDPTDDELMAYHQSHLPDFTTPTIKQITYAWLTPEMIIDTVEVDEDSLRAAYDERHEEFNQPERRLVERLAFGTDEAAKAALARVTAEEATFDGLVAERGLELVDVDLGDVSQPELGAAGEAVFTAQAGDVVGPLESPVGPALYRVNGILQAHNTSFEEAEPTLRDELASDRARRVIDARIETIDDLLAGGATIEELAQETDMQQGRIDWHPGMAEEISAYDSFRDAAKAVTADDYPEVKKLQDEGIFALRLDKIVEPQVQPLAEVRDRAEQGWRQEAIVKALHEQVEPQLDKLNAGESFADLGMARTTTLEVTRSTFQPDAPPEFIDTVFGLEKDDAQILDGDGRIFVMRLDDLQPPDEEDKELVRLRDAVTRDASGGLSQDLYQALASDIRSRTPVELNQAALNAVHSNFQ